MSTHAPDERERELGLNSCKHKDTHLLLQIYQLFESKSQNCSLLYVFLYLPIKLQIVDGLYVLTEYIINITSA